MSGEKVSHNIVIGDINAPGVLGFFYAKLGSKIIKNAVLKSYRPFF